MFISRTFVCNQSGRLVQFLSNNFFLQIFEKRFINKKNTITYLSLLLIEGQAIFFVNLKLDVNDVGNLKSTSVVYPPDFLTRANRG